MGRPSLGQGLHGTGASAPLPRQKTPTTHPSTTFSAMVNCCGGSRPKTGSKQLQLQEQPTFPLSPRAAGEIQLLGEGPALELLPPPLPRRQGKARLTSLPFEEHQPKPPAREGPGLREGTGLQDGVGGWSQLKLAPTQSVTGRILGFALEAAPFHIIWSNLLNSFPQGANREGPVLPKVAERLGARAGAIQVS